MGMEFMRDYRDTFRTGQIGADAQRNAAMSWKWINQQALVTLHDMSLAEHGGAAGVRDQGLF